MCGWSQLGELSVSLRFVRFFPRRPALIFDSFNVPRSVASFARTHEFACVSCTLYISHRLFYIGRELTFARSINLSEFFGISEAPDGFSRAKISMLVRECRGTGRPPSFCEIQSDKHQQAECLRALSFCPPLSLSPPRIIDLISIIHNYRRRLSAERDLSATSVARQLAIAQKSRLDLYLAIVLLKRSLAPRRIAE